MTKPTDPRDVIHPREAADTIEKEMPFCEAQSRTKAPQRHDPTKGR